MKKAIVCFSIIALVTTTASAQIRIGLKAGLNIATWTGADATSTNLPGKANKTGLNVGVLAKIPITSNFSVQPEAVYSTEGVKLDAGTFQLTYLNVPVLAKYKFSNSNFSVATGPQVGLLTSAKFKPTNGTVTDIKNQYQSIDYAWATSVSYLARCNFGIDLRYNVGIYTIDKNNPKRNFNNSVLQLGAFYMLSGKGGKSGKSEKKGKKAKKAKKGK